MQPRKPHCDRCPFCIPNSD
ncbi:MAG: hypothetical protein HQ515_22920 [Phycisphaeraceae bacterium]|nr:hypothetical protein [Phycisphaeraceae bacterium]